MREINRLAAWSFMKAVALVFSLALALSAGPAMAQTSGSDGNEAAAVSTEGVMQEAEQVIGNAFEFFEPVAETGLAGIFSFLGAQSWVFILWLSPLVTHWAGSSLVQSHWVRRRVHCSPLWYSR